MQDYLEVQDTLSSVGTAYFEFACFGGGDPSEKNGLVTETVAYIVLPICLIAIAGLITFVAFFLKGGSDNGLKNARSAALGVASITLFLLQPSLVKQFALLFSCVKMGSGSDDLFLLQNLAVQCYSDDHWQLLLSLGLPLLFLYVIGIPLILFLILSAPVSRLMIQDITRAHQVGQAAVLTDPVSLSAASAAHAALDHTTQAFEKSYAFLFLGYKPELYLWEIAVLARKGCLSLIGVAFSTDPRTQVMLGLLLIFLSTIAHARFMPFENDLMNNYEFLSLFTSAMTFFIGVFTMENNAYQDYASMFAFVINIIYVLITIPIALTVHRRAEEIKKVHKAVLKLSNETASGKEYEDVELELTTLVSERQTEELIDQDEQTHIIEKKTGKIEEDTLVEE